MKKNILIIICFIIFTFTLTTCKKFEHLTLIKTISYTGGNATGEIVDLSSVSHPVYGFCWATTPNPTVLNEKKELNNPQVGTFSCNITPTSVGTWYLRAFIQEKNNIIYANQITFQYLPLPIVTTLSVSNITSSAASCGGKVIADSGITVTARGVCWSKSQNPTLSNSHTTDGSGTGSFTSSMTGLMPGATYYVCAYAIGNAGTSYGQQVSFNSNSTLPTVATSSVSNIRLTTASCGGNVTADGGATVTARGVCWSTSQNPTISNPHTTDGNGIGSFSSSVTGLTTNTTYYIRAYATNIAGTAYGNQNFFMPSSNNIVTDIDGNTYDIINIGAQVWMKENLTTTRYNDGKGIFLVTDSTVWNNLTTPGRCYYNNDSLSFNNLNGALYNWYTVNTGKLCPTGWHVPSDGEWNVLEKYLDNSVDTTASDKWVGTNIGDQLKEAGTFDWGNGNNGTNSSGFTALPGGGCGSVAGYPEFNGIGSGGYWWSSSTYNATNAWFRNLIYNNSKVFRNVNSKTIGFSVRCVRNY